ncbi:uncharacterized protein LOC132041071 isoform X2 [Lycium ferocissimum]|uniref:uncharacterized protein LOC132041071 isoform X2 n=1 Tax=Lycium ferocissimum TaxID=112874 RepID=UPI0028158FD3|nr:uncharacterized protein LOC132041071 isoform X2 [Lycium ferocissimum]
MFYDLLPFAFLHPISSLQSSPLCHPSSDQFSTGFVSFSGCVFLQLFGLRLSITNAFVISVSRKNSLQQEAPIWLRMLRLAGVLAGYSNVQLCTMVFGSVDQFKGAFVNDDQSGECYGPDLCFIHRYVYYPYMQ